MMATRMVNGSRMVVSKRLETATVIAVITLVCIEVDHEFTAVSVEVSWVFREATRRKLVSDSSETSRIHDLWLVSFLRLESSVC